MITQWELKVVRNAWRKDYWGYVRPRTEYKCIVSNKNDNWGSATTNLACDLYKILLYLLLVKIWLIIPYQSKYLDTFVINIVFYFFFYVRCFHTKFNDIVSRWDGNWYELRERDVLMKINTFAEINLYDTDLKGFDEESEYWIYTFYISQKW